VEEDSLPHLFFRCIFVRIAWRSFHWPLDSLKLSSLNLLNWIKGILFPNQTFGIPLADIHLFQIYAAILCDMLCFSRNKAIRKGVLPDASKFAEDISRISLDHHAAWKTKAQPMRELWSPLQVGNFKVNFDTAIRDLFSVQAAVCRDSTGAILYQYSPPSEVSYDEA
jgi:hypothetical protein